MSTFITVIHIVAGFFLIGLVLLQSGKGAEISASFAGSSQTVFGASGGANFFTRATAVLAAVFMVTSLTLTVVANRTKKSVFEGVATPPPAAQTQPAVPPAPVDASKAGTPSAPAAPAAKK